MKFDELLNSLFEKQNKNETPEYLPWSIEIVKDPQKSKEYNELGDLIIKLFELRARL